MGHVTDFRGEVMKRFVAIIAAAAAMFWFSTPADAGAPIPKEQAGSTSRARAQVNQKWSPWVLSPTPEGNLLNMCTETVHYKAVKDKVRQRTRLIPGGNTEIESKGALVLELTPQTQPGHHYRFDISGPSLGKNSQIQYTNGDYLYRATGASLTFFRGTTVEGTGMPRLAYTVGAIGNLSNATRADIITRPKTVVDVCRYMGLDSAP